MASVFPLDYGALEPDLTKAMFALHRSVDGAGLEKALIHLVKFRASQLNGCAHCIDFHARDAASDGESEKRLHMVAVWRDSVLFTPREQAALAWTEALTRIDPSGLDPQVRARVAKEFSEVEMVRLTALIGMINFWNRISVGCGTPHAT